MKATMTVSADQAVGTISRHIYGHFAEHLGRCIYEGIWVGEDSPIPNTRGIRNDVVEALRGLNIPVLRWPGGCFADEYHWKDGVGPREQRKRMVNTHWAAWWRITTSERMNFLICVNCLVQSLIFAAMSGAAPCKRCKSGSSI